MTTLTDERTLLKRAQTSAAGFGNFFDAHYDRIYKYAYRRVGVRENAEDIAATVFEDALKGIKRVRWQNKPLVAWLYKIAARRVADFYRANSAIRDLASAVRAPTPESEGSVGADFVEHVERNEEHARVRHALSCLSASDRELVRLVYFDELDRAEIAAILGCTSNAVYVRLHRALKKMEKVLNDEHNSN